MKYANSSLCVANGFKSNTSKERAQIAGADGKCEYCDQSITQSVDMVKWNRRFGAFHAKCYGLAGNGNAPASSGISESDVERIVNAAMQERPQTPVVSHEALVKLVKQEVERVAPRELHVTRTEGVKKIVKKLKHAHAMLEKLLCTVSMNHHAYLYGPPGSGKSTGAKHAADALGRKFGYISLNPQTPESRLLGYNDANGKYVKTVLYDLYINGGVYCIDEMDNASAGLLTTLNSLLENGSGAFPNGNVERHPDFVVVATGNTAGRGGNMQFPERRAFDAAFAERFDYLPWGYDESLERDVALTINAKSGEWIVWVQRVRAFAKQHDPKLVVSPRATFKIADYTLQANPFTTEDMLDAVLFKGIERERVQRILSNCSLPAVG